MKKLRHYFTTNELEILGELAEIDQHIAWRPLVITFHEQDEESQKRYQAIIFSIEAGEDTIEWITVELVK